MALTLRVQQRQLIPEEAETMAAVVVTATAEWQQVKVKMVINAKPIIMIADGELNKIINSR